MVLFQEIGKFIEFAWAIFWYWWWVPAFFFFSGKFDDYWRWWRRELWYGTVWKALLLEIKIPKELPKPITAMEAMFTALHGVTFNDPDWWEKYVSGEPQTTYKFEIAAIDGKIHFYIRVFAEYRDAVEAAVYSQFPGAEIEAVPDYTKQVPMDMPNRDWDLYGRDYFMTKPPQYPIPTYEKFAEPNAEEEEKVDPITSLMEGMSKLRPGEQMWVQISAKPIYFDLPDGKKFVKGGEEIRDILTKRKEKNSDLPPLWQELLEAIFHGPKTEEEKTPELFPAEMRLTTEERELIDAVEKKITKPFFKCYIRNMYLGRRDAFYLPNRRYLFSYFENFTSASLNSLWTWTKTLTRVKRTPIPFIDVLQDRREYVKKRRMLRVYRDRLAYYNPWSKGDIGSQIRLNVEEMATIYHFPSHIVSPTPGIQRTESKESVAPGNLPV
jgi:hypothetical protein